MTYESNLEIIRSMMLKLLPMQLVLCMVGAINGIVSTYFATNYVGMEAMSAMGLYSPLSMFIGALSAMITGGCAIIIGKYMGRNEKDKIQEVFSLDLAISSILAVVVTVICVCLSMFNMTWIFVSDPALRPVFNRYMLWQCTGVFPLVLGGQLANFLTVENKDGISLKASIVYIIVNVVLNYLFIQVFHMEEAGVALASSLGMWVFMLIQLVYFFSKDSMLKVRFRIDSLSSVSEVLSVGFPGATGYIYMTVRGIVVNRLLESCAGSAGVSAFATANNALNLAWGIPTAMVSVSRLLMSVSIGEEDRRTLTDITNVVFTVYLPLMILAVGGLFLLAEPVSALFYDDASSEVFGIMRTCMRILPLGMPFSLLIMHFTAYAQNSDKKVFVNIFSIIDGFLGVVVFANILAPLQKTAGICFAVVLSAVICDLYIFGYAWHKNRHVPHDWDELMVIPEDFGVDEDERMDLSVDTIEEVVFVSQRIQEFCLEKGIDEKRSYLAGLSMEEMAANIVEHGFTRDSHKHSIDIRVVHKNDSVILRIKDDCIPFNPEDRSRLTDDPEKNLGIYMIYTIMHDITYQNMLGLNVLTIKI